MLLTQGRLWSYNILLVNFMLVIMLMIAFETLMLIDYNLEVLKHYQINFSKCCTC
jgi:hypothetical protein